MTCVMHLRTTNVRKKRLTPSCPEKRGRAFVSDNSGNQTPSERDRAYVGRGRAFSSGNHVEEEPELDEEEAYDDRGAFKLRQDNYVRPDFPPLSSGKPPAPFPEALKDTRIPVNDKEMFETFSKCEVNIPLLKLVKSIPRYAKFLKELCTIKRNQKLKGKQKVQVSERVSAVLRKPMPEKHEDPGMFTIPIVIGETKFDKAMLDLGASINVLPSSIYESLALGPLLKTDIVIQLADGSYVHPRGVVEDVLVRIDRLFFPADFFVLDTCENGISPIMLGRPFMSTSRTKIDVFGGMMTMEFDGEVIEHNIHEVNSLSIPSVCRIDSVEPHDIILNGKIPPSSPTVLGNSPTLLITQGKVPASSVTQVKKNKATHPPTHSKCGGGKKKKVRQVWSVTEVNGLRFKPFHKWFKDEILRAEVTKGPKGYG